jgi:hypothetical protein
MHPHNTTQIQLKLVATKFLRGMSSLCPLPPLIAHHPATRRGRAEPELEPGAAVRHARRRHAMRWRRAGRMFASVMDELLVRLVAAVHKGLSAFAMNETNHC